MRYEELTEHTVKDLLTAIWRYYQEHVQTGEYETKAEFLEAYREVKSQLVFPRTVYRGISPADNILFDARRDEIAHLDPENEYDASKIKALHDFVQSIRWESVGTCWTWDKDSAAVGGMLDEHEPNVILEARISYADVDIATTLWQNLTVYQEEQEIRLKPNRNIKIIGVAPNLIERFPIRANTGPLHGDETDSQTIQKYLSK